MAWIQQWIRRFRLFVGRNGAERAMRDELSQHLAYEIAERTKSGMSPESARLSALRDFGGLEQIKEEARDARGIRPLEDLVADARYGMRVLRRNPAFTAAAALTFALGIGIASAIFSVVYGVLLRPLPYREPGRLVVLWERNIPRNLDRNVVAVGNFEAWRDQSRVFDGMAALVPRPVTLAGGTTPERVAGAEVSVGYFRLLGINPLLGRDFRPEDATPQSTAVILSHGFWTRKFGADPAVIGRTLHMSGRPYTVVGVMPADFEPPRFGWLALQELWFPFVVTPENRAWGRFLLVVARLAPGASLVQARAETTILADRLAREIPGNAGWAISVIPLAAQITGEARPTLIVLLGAVGLLLLIAVTNVATLTLSLMRRRARELATRRSLGATDQRLFRQLLIQSTLVGLLGTGVGLLAVWPSVRVLVAFAPPEIPRLASIRVDMPVLVVTALVALLATLVFGTITAARATSKMTVALATPQSGDSRTSARTGGAVLVVAEICIALALGVMAMLMVRSFVSLRAVDLGFTADRVLATRVAIAGPDIASPERLRAFFDTFLERIRGLPDVESAGFISTRPFGGLGPATEVSDPRQPAAAATGSTVADVRYTDAGLFRTLRVPVDRGALFDASDATAARPQVVISESLAHTLWPGQNAVGHPIRMDLFDGIEGDVIGVVGDVHLMDTRTAPRPAAFLSDARFPSETRDLVVRVKADPSSVVPSLRRVLASLAPDAPLYQIVPVPQMIAASLAADRFTTFVLSLFAAIALVLGGVGVFGVISGEVASRRKEIGIRMALGATASAVVAMMLRQSFVRAAAGVLAGGLLALSLAHAMASLLFGVGPADPVSFGTSATVVFGLAAIATLIPAIHALRTSPLVALREG
jgi:putative ABC transport system permease protein